MTDGLDDDRHDKLKRTLYRIFLMLIRLIARGEVVAESEAEYDGIEYRYEYHEAEYDYDCKYLYEEREEPEPSRSAEDGMRDFANEKLIVGPR